MNEIRVLIFVVTYNAERTIAPVLQRIPRELFRDKRFNLEILVIDDCSSDETFRKGTQFRESFKECPLTVLRNPRNLGYGGNQKLGYRYAIEAGFDVVVLLHGDGQYAPEELPRLLEPFVEKRADAVFGSRMMIPGAALKGRMPLYKYVGNKVLTFLENTLVGTALSEYHSGYRLYSVPALQSVPFERNSDGFDFDTEIIIQFHAAGLRIEEQEIPTFYGDEICYVNGVQYALKILRTCVQYRCQRLGIFYDPKFDLAEANDYYTAKFDFVSSHSLALGTVVSQDRVLIAGCGPAGVTVPFAARARETSLLDQFLSPELKRIARFGWEGDLDQFQFENVPDNLGFDRVLALDIIEHLREPETFLEKLRNAKSCQQSTLVLTTPNVAFLPIRLMLLLGFFNYGKRGILDRTHTRLFTFGSLRKVLTTSGFEITRMRGIPAPLPLALGRGVLGRLGLAVNDALCRLLPSLFSYQIFVECRPRPTTETLLGRAIRSEEDVGTAQVV